MDQPTQSDLKSLLASIEEVQSKILQTLGPNEQIKKGLAAELEPLKAPVFFWGGAAWIWNGERIARKRR